MTKKKCDHERSGIRWLPHPIQLNDMVIWHGQCKCELPVYEQYESQGIYAMLGKEVSEDDNYLME